MLLQKESIDSASRALAVALSVDSYYCFYCPALVLYACPAVRRNIRLAPCSENGRGNFLAPTGALGEVFW